ncbi:hypothetical protein ACFQVA_19790 [Actinomadura keratinilytica]
MLNPRHPGVRRGGSYATPGGGPAWGASYQQPAPAKGGAAGWSRRCWRRR